MMPPFDAVELHALSIDTPFLVVFFIGAAAEYASEMNVPLKMKRRTRGEYAMPDVLRKRPVLQKRNHVSVMLTTTSANEPTASAPSRPSPVATSSEDRDS